MYKSRGNTQGVLTITRISFGREEAKTIFANIKLPTYNTPNWIIQDYSGRGNRLHHNKPSLLGKSVWTTCDHILIYVRQLQVGIFYMGR